MDRMHSQNNGYCTSVIRVSLQVSLLKPSWKMSMLTRACAGPFLVSVKKLKVIQGSPFFGLLVPEKNTFKGFIPCMGMVAILVIWPGSFEQIFFLPIHECSTWNLASMGLATSQQKMFESINLSDLGQRSNNDLDLWYSYVFMNSLSQLSVPTFSHRLQ